MTYQMMNVPLGDFPDAPTIWSAVNAAGHYIGDEDTAKRLDAMGIEPEVIPGNRVCSIGFCEREQRWYGWSHRAIAGFGVGSEVKRGDIAYVPVDWDDFLSECVRFWTEDWHVNVRADRGTDSDGQPCAIVRWEYTDDVPNEGLRGQPGSVKSYPPAEWGKGEWTAATLDDAKQMAIAFAEDIA